MILNGLDVCVGDLYKFVHPISETILYLCVSKEIIDDHLFTMWLLYENKSCVLRLSTDPVNIKWNLKKL